MEKQLHRKGAVIGGLIVAAGGVVVALLSRGSSAPTITVSPVFHNDIQLTTASAPVEKPTPPPAPGSAPYVTPLAPDLDGPVEALSRRRHPPEQRQSATLTLEENQPATPAGIPAALSVTFGSLEGAEFATLIIAPSGEPAAPHAVLGPGANIPFHSLAGERFNLQVLSVDFAAHKVAVRVDRLPHPPAE